MGWRRFTEIEAWGSQSSCTMSFSAILDRPQAAHDRRFCEDARNALASPARNIAEGFGRYGHREFANFVNIARASHLETQTNLILARDRRFMTPDEFERIWAISDEAIAATTGLLKYLRRRARGAT
jgi:four helix bundle protein